MFGLLGLLMDMSVMWMLLNFMSDESWDDQKLKVFLITLGIAICGGVATYLAAPYIGLLTLGIYFLVGFLILAFATSMSAKQSAIAMAIFLAYKLVLTFVFHWMKSA